jgi:hypothetical protein
MSPERRRPITVPRHFESTPVSKAWLEFTRGVRVLLVPQPDDRPLDQFLAMRDKVYEMVQSERFLAEFDGAWRGMTVPAMVDTADALVMELKAIPLALEVAQNTEPEAESPGWIRRLLGRASTVTGSVRDIVQNLPPYAKNAITLFKELVDLFKGRE